MAVLCESEVETHVIKYNKKGRLTKGRVKSGIRKKYSKYFTGINNVCFHLNGEFAGTDLINIHYKPMYIN